MLHPNQFNVNEAWIFFKLNHVPVATASDGEFNVFALMDAASCFILGSEMISVCSAEPSNVELRRMLEGAWSQKEAWPKRLLISADQEGGTLAAEADSLGIEVTHVTNKDISVFTREAQEGFKAHFGGDEVH